MVYGYCRVSTKGQAKDGNSLEGQEKTLRENGAVEIYSDSFTGTKITRPELDKLLGLLQEGDTLMVTKLDRIARSLIQGSELINKLINKGIKVYILNMGVMDNTPSSRLMRNMFFSFAEFERDMILERTAEGKAIARLKVGFKEGRPKKFSQKQINHALELLSINGGEHSYRQVEDMTGISKNTLIRENNKRKAI
ncbi:MAG TPA: resolvase [Clostridiales bacterium]|nr:resolvase [Clostridiales bacterium]